MSHKGTMPTDSNCSSFENCLNAVAKCDLFLGIITTNYGSGKDKDGLSIVHQEILKAIELNKPRWLLAHDHVIFARRLLIDLKLWPNDENNEISLIKGAKSIDDLRVIKMYEDATQEIIPLRDRVGNWVQKYNTDEDAALFAVAQFSRYQEAETFIRENIKSNPGNAE